MRHAAPALALLILAACSGKSPNEAQADRLENAAEQSSPEAADVLRSEADRIRDEGAAGAPGEPGSTTQQAMENAALAAAGERQAPVPGPAPEPKQALPRTPGQGTPTPDR